MQPLDLQIARSLTTGSAQVHRYGATGQVADHHGASQVTARVLTAGGTCHAFGRVF
jgi:hypothetical protein